MKGGVLLLSQYEKFKEPLKLSKTKKFTCTFERRFRSIIKIIRPPPLPVTHTHIRKSKIKNVKNLADMHNNKQKDRDKNKQTERQTKNRSQKANLTLKCG